MSVDGRSLQVIYGATRLALGARMTTAFAKYGWCAAIRGVEGGRWGDGLPRAQPSANDEGDVALKWPTELASRPSRRRKWGSGFIPLSCKGHDYALSLAYSPPQIEEIRQGEATPMPACHTAA